MANKKEQIDEELEVLLSEKELNILGKQVIVKRYSMLDTIRLASQAGKIVATAMNNADLITNAINKMVYTDSDGDTGSENSIRLVGIMQLLDAFGEDGVELIKVLITKATNLTQSEVEELDLSDGIDLLEIIYEVNKGFFLKSLKKLQEKLPKNENEKEQTS